ncbi:hypothetical protein D9613_000984 [Agrocybe pediades]|uniref:AA9 family lytic polysaccharide monooxygenase n=1 Tax=Agrocybe pediades TaxID=84607 RepID=A0A8H4R0G1_9AGAR|nr:hypothetical protein D9613_000984 [Agrocybe pediades]
MKFSGLTLLGAALLATQSVSAHYIFKTLVAGGKTSTAAVRQPVDLMPYAGITTSSSSARCNVNPGKASETVTVGAGDKVGFQLSNNMYHEGPVSIYLGQAPGSAAEWDGSGERWFKIAEFTGTGQTEFTTTIPVSVPNGEYLVRIEQVGMHLGTGVTEAFISCGQIKVTGGGNGNPPKVAIPGHIHEGDHSVTVDIYNNNGAPYTCPGPAVWRG